MKPYLILIAGIWAVIGAIDAIVTVTAGSRVNDSTVFLYVGPAIVIAAALAANAIRRRRDIRNRTIDPDSVERTLSTRARAGAMFDGLVITLAVGVLLLVAHNVFAPLAVFLAAVATAIDFYIRYAVLLHRARAEG